ncbi:STP1 protein [Plasmodium ovale wallikeri]|uniref:STP1 protein n=1 Tax=Plasmodium ovale wallikeri TaxID=864142 RepID=A0A1A9AT12_PLAOA|nr:STP1 protein [Plasmodium ovale wallikeri]
MLNSIVCIYEYFNIRNKCNYPWLISIIPDVTCTQFTRTKPTEKDSPSKSLADTDQTTTVVTHSNSPGGKNDTPAAVQPFSEGDGSPPSAKVPDSPQDKSPTQSKNGAGTDHNSQQDTFNIQLEGTPVAESTPIFELRPAPQPALNPKHLLYTNLLNSNNYLRGNIIPHIYSHSTNMESIKNSEIFRSYVDGEPIKTNIKEPNNLIPLNVLYSQKFVQLLRSQRFVELLRLQPFRNLPFSKRFLSYHLNKERFIPPIIHSKQVTPTIPYAEFDVPKPKPIKTQIKDIVKVEKDPAIPGPSRFRYPFMIYTLVFLTISTAITIFYLLSKYTSFGLLFDKKKKKKKLKRQLEIKKIPEESTSFDKITNYSVNDMPYENKTHDDNNIYTKIKIQKSIINKNISLPKKKKNKGKAIIDIHMEMLNECKNDEWELNKNDFLEICLEELYKS